VSLSDHAHHRHAHHHAHDHAHDHSHHHARPSTPEGAQVSFSLLRLSVVERIGLSLILLICLWLALAAVSGGVGGR
jgi:ABC-type Zn2+ transport system substrate-binding protein/surface adhesin